MVMELEGYTYENELGLGKFSQVAKMKCLKTGNFVAVKKYVISPSQAINGIPPHILREVALLRMLNGSKFVIGLLDTKHYRQTSGEIWYFLVCEYMEMNLSTYLQGNTLKPDEIKILMYQLCQGVAFIHGRGVMHRDLKPHNILINSKTLGLKIGDFNLSRQMIVPSEPYSLEVGYPGYRPPEICLKITGYTMASDMWSVGCIFGEMVHGRILFKTDDKTAENLEQIFKELGTPTEEEWPGIDGHLGKQHTSYPRINFESSFPTLAPLGTDLLSKMLVYNPSNRISAKKAVEHIYFSDKHKGDVKQY